MRTEAENPVALRDPARRERGGEERRDGREERRERREEGRRGEGGRTPPYSTLWKGRALQKREHLSLYTHITNIYLPHIQTLLLCAYNIHKYIRTIEAIENFNNYRAVITVKHRREELRERERERGEKFEHVLPQPHRGPITV